MTVNTNKGEVVVKLTKGEMKAIETASETYKTLAKFSDPETAAKLEQAAAIERETIKTFQVTTA